MIEWNLELPAGALTRTPVIPGGPTGPSLPFKPISPTSPLVPSGPVSPLSPWEVIKEKEMQGTLINGPIYKFQTVPLFKTHNGWLQIKVSTLTAVTCKQSFSNLAKATQVAGIWKHFWDEKSQRFDDPQTRWWLKVGQVSAAHLLLHHHKCRGFEFSFFYGERLLGSQAFTAGNHM